MAGDVPGSLVLLDGVRWHATALGTDPRPDLQRLHAERLAQDRPVWEVLLYDPSRLIGREERTAVARAAAETMPCSRANSQRFSRAVRFSSTERADR
jgi:hypothetical protein